LAVQNRWRLANEQPRQKKGGLVYERGEDGVALNFQHQEARNERVPSLDGVRGIAIMLVVLWHYLVQGVEPIPGTIGSYVLHALSLSWSGVDLFFVLSGYLIGGILLDHINDQNWWSVFYTRRSLRIVPLYALGLLVGAAFCATTNAMPFIYFLSFTQNFWIGIHSSWPSFYVATWSLAVEEQFYILLPLLVWLLPRKSLPPVIAALIVIAPICRVFAFDYFKSPVAPYVLFPCRMDSLLFGVLCAYAMRHERFREWVFRNSAIVYFTFAISLAWPVLATLEGWGWESFQMESFGLTLVAFTYSCFLLIVVVERSGPIVRLTNLAPLRRLGILAYCIYLIHIDVYNIVSKYTGLNRSSPEIRWIYWVVIILMLAVIAELSWRFFEGPLISFGRRRRYAAPAMSSPDAGTAVAAPIGAS
jgi:peptidoglycan/LPS O-acetylase OafA/YrhL